MEEQTLQQFKDAQRRSMQDLISKGRLVNDVTGFETSRMLDRSLVMNENKRRKKKWAKYAEQSKQKTE